MSHSERIGDNEIILRRIRPRRTPDEPETTKWREGRGLTATSWAIQPRKRGEFPSWSRQTITSAARLLAIEASKGTDVSDWLVAAVHVRSIRALRLDVIPKRTEEDDGHCLIVPTDQQAFTGGVWSRLAKETWIIPKADA